MTLKASELTLNDLLTISTKPGKRLQDLNFSLTSMDAWAVLRTDLINALGIQRAKRFILRYAYRSGMHEARILKEKIKWNDDLEWLLAGSKMHNLTGRSFSYPEDFNVDMENGQFNVSGYWIDSSEVKQHLEYFPMHVEPICYFLIGYASGYTSECLGKQIVFKEIKCKGKGDDHCSYTGKTVEEWGDEISEELLYYEDEDMSGELDQMYQQIERQKERLETGYSLSRNLTKVMLQGGGFKEFAELLGKSLHCEVIIENMNYEVIGKYGDNPGMERNMSASNFWNKSNENIPEFVETDLKDKTFKLLTTPILLENEVYGFITIALNQKSDSYHKDLLERVAVVVALYMQNQRVAIETEQRLKGELLEQLLNEKSADVMEIYNRFSYLGYDLKQPHYIIYIEINDRTIKEDINTNYDFLKIRRQLTNLFQGENKYRYNTPVLTKLNAIQTIVPKQFLYDEKTTIQDFGERLLKEFDDQDKQICIGISDTTENLTDFNSRSKEAKKAVELAKFRSRESGVILSSELGNLTLFLNAREPEELESFANGKLQEILNYDRKKNSELLETLFYYTQNEFNLHKTARVMSISISGMRYRILKIEELLSIELSNSNSRFEIQMALQIYLLLGKIKPI
ncbi:XylR N-terminal domain-containing protein [Sporosarcina sp. P18a]|uniref:XylR N-terminal domain-containing protein n=1 Tax=Sporosarcina sp. P18a TaxID=2048259 RepID=UPI001304090D|nr:XylR N-terminal domain-containing protein [Sporosarcina sp. P18a]